MYRGEPTTTVVVPEAPEVQPLKVRDKAAKKVLDIIEERGWTQGSMEYNGQVCLTGAGLVADYGKVPRWVDQSDGWWQLIGAMALPFFSPTVRRIGRKLPRVPTSKIMAESGGFLEFLVEFVVSRTYVGRVIHFNDSVIDGKGELIDYLERRAYGL